jgi:hypothetical protein
LHKKFHQYDLFFMWQTDVRLPTLFFIEPFFWASSFYLYLIYIFYYRLNISIAQVWCITRLISYYLRFHLRYLIAGLNNYIILSIKGCWVIFQQIRVNPNGICVVFILNTGSLKAATACRKNSIHKQLAS